MIKAEFFDTPTATRTWFNSAPFDVGATSPCVATGLVVGNHPAMSYETAPNALQTKWWDLTVIWPEVRCTYSSCTFMKENESS